MENIYFDSKDQQNELLKKIKNKSMYFVVENLHYPTIGVVAVLENTSVWTVGGDYLQFKIYNVGNIIPHFLPKSVIYDLPQIVGHSREEAIKKFIKYKNKQIKKQKEDNKTLIKKLRKNLKNIKVYDQ